MFFLDVLDVLITFQLDMTVSMEQYGFVVAADALGQMIFSPIFGFIADRLNSVRLVSLSKYYKISSKMI